MAFDYKKEYKEFYMPEKVPMTMSLLLSHSCTSIWRARGMS